MKAIITKIDGIETDSYKLQRLRLIEFQENKKQIDAINAVSDFNKRKALLCEATETRIKNAPIMYSCDATKEFFTVNINKTPLSAEALAAYKTLTVEKLTPQLITEAHLRYYQNFSNLELRHEINFMHKFDLPLVDKIDTFNDNTFTQLGIDLRAKFPKEPISKPICKVKI
jgi:hypothetical protein